jgi:hypothetical protein
VKSFKQDVLERAMAVSPGFKDYLAEQTGIIDFAGLPEGDINIGYSKSIGFIEDELHSMGIFLIGEDQYTERLSVILIITLRELFDTENLLKTCVSESFKDGLQSLVDNMDYDIDMFITNVIERIQALRPLSVSWGVLFSNRFRITCTDAFFKHIVAILEMDVPVDTELLVKASKFSMLVIQHIEDAKLFYEKIMTNFVSGESQVAFVEQKYDVDLNQLPGDALDMYITSDSKYILSRNRVNDVDFIKNHKLSVPHHFEYFISRKVTTLTDLQICVLVAEYAIPNPSVAYFQSEIEPLLKQTMFDEITISKIKQFFDFGYSV